MEDERKGGRAEHCGEERERMRKRKREYIETAGLGKP
jgi:hypothetical protein